VALLLGTCWALSNGFQPADKPTTPAGPNVVDPSKAEAGVLEEIRKSNAIKGEKGITPPKIELP
jgi:hypothetical protein